MSKKTLDWMDRIREGEQKGWLSGRILGDLKLYGEKLEENMNEVI